MVAFDTAKVERALREPLGDEAAREVTEALAEGMGEHLATREDLERLGNEFRHDLRSEIGGVRTEISDVRAEVAEVRASLREAEQRILIRLGAWTLAVMSVGFALLRLTL